MAGATGRVAHLQGEDGPFLLCRRRLRAEAFRQQYEQGPMSYLREARMRRAAALLRSSDLTVADIAGRVGYASRSQFSRAFASRFGVAPAAFRAAAVA